MRYFASLAGVIFIAASLFVFFSYPTQTLGMGGGGGGMGGTCDIAANNHAFGSYNTFSPTPLDATSTITINCSDCGGMGGDCNHETKIDAGQNSGGSFNPRKMSSGGDMLNYNLYRNSSRTEIWGDGTSGTYTVTGSNDQTWTIYGRVPALQNSSVGSYSDTLQATVTF